jgi:5-methylthioribose kinase
VLATVAEVWTGFRDKFLALWRANGAGDAFPQSLFEDKAGAAALEAERSAYMARLWADTVGFAAAKMIRRILGLAHNIDLEWIKDADRRAACEARALMLARDMMVHVERYPDPAALSAAARELRKQAFPS